MAETNTRSFTHLIAIGSSAGGIEALSTLVSGLPSDFSAPVVIAQHLDPRRISHLGEILARRTTLPVRTITDTGTQSLEPGAIYVVPSNRDVFIADTRLELRPESRHPAPSVDLLLTSAAAAYGERLIAVILTGSGTDGAAGARVVKKAGGTVIVQNPDTAAYPSMPMALAPTTVDIIANLDRIGSILRDLLAGIEAPAQPAEKEQFDDFLRMIRERFDIDFTTYKTPTILRRLQRRILATDSVDLKGYINYLKLHPQEYQHLINAFLIKVTDFFRDPELYTYLREQVLPNLIDYARKNGNELRIWSAGCATGEEAYSLAILVAEALGSELDQYNIRIFATDVDAEAIAFARRGMYPASALTSLPEDLINRYFTKDDGQYQIRKRIRALTVFGQHDLGQRAPFPRIDMIVCRNVLIYFTSELQQRTLKLFAYSLRDGGYLVLGKAESTGNFSEYFTLQHKTHKIYKRHGDRILMPPAYMKDPLHASVRRPEGRAVPPNLIASLGDKEDKQHVRNQTENLLLMLPVGVVMVDRHYDIQIINSAARHLLSIHGSAIGEDLIHLVQNLPQARLRNAIDTAFRTRTSTILDEVPVDELITGTPRYLQITCHPQPADSDQAASTVVVAVQDVTALVQGRREAEQQAQIISADLQHNKSAADAEAARRDQLIDRLVDTNRQLLEANEELTSANEELRSTNEEFLVSAEEAQASTEEVETLNEELQATNEELETLNEELQATIEELNTTNDDLHARSVELQDLARTSEDERARLSAILVSMADAVLVVNTSGVPILTNAAFERMFGADQSRYRPQDENGRALPSELTPHQRAARGESFTMEFTTTSPDGIRHWFEASGQPVPDAGGHHQWGVVVIRDITERSLHRLQDEFLTMASHELRQPLTPLLINAQMLRKALDPLPDADKPRHLAEVSLSEIGRLSRLVNDLFDVSRLQSGKLTIQFDRVQLNDLLARTIEIAQTLSPGIHIVLQTVNTPLVVNGDADRLEQVLLNLLSNAITHAPSTEDITVLVRGIAHQAEIQVQDHGPGIPAADLPHLFSRFYQATNGNVKDTYRKGLGLGLYISREIVTMHGGTIDVSSTSGQGTIFTIRLPLVTESGSRRNA
ncbi:MAG TPA: CheR family methyltransferase [Ktedonobacterales bacterium]